MMTVHSLRTVYARRLGDEQMGNIENLFRRTLEIRDASLNDLVAELEKLREVGSRDISRMRALYKYLDKSVARKSDMRYVFGTF